MARKTTSSSSTKRKSTEAARPNKAATSMEEAGATVEPQPVEEKGNPDLEFVTDTASKDAPSDRKSPDKEMTLEATEEKSDSDTTKAEDDQVVSSKDDMAETSVEGDKPDTPTSVPETETDDKSEQVHTVPSVPPTAPEKKRGVFPAILAGLIAGGIGGAGASYYYATTVAAGDERFAEIRASTESAIAEQGERLDTLQDQIAANVPDLSGLENAQAQFEAGLGNLNDRLGTAEDSLEKLSSRLSELQQETLASALSEDAIEGYRAEFDALQDAMATQRLEIEAMTEAARQMEASAEETAQATLRRAALSRIQTALESGEGYADALADFKTAGASVPDSLEAAAANGVETLASLQEGFPSAARAALAAARDSAARSGETGGAKAFLRNVLGARSLEPREGSDPDAILSRAEAAVRENRLRDALAEIEALPDGARAETSDWVARVEKRLEAVEAVQRLSEELN